MTAVEAAERAAKAFARGKGLDWREYLGAAWQGVAAATAGSTDGGRVTAGVWAAARQFREDGRGGWTAASRHGRRKRLAQFDPDAGEPPAREPVTPAEVRLVGAWADTRGDRAGWPWRTRVALYLIAVEGWSAGEVAAAFGVGSHLIGEQLRRSAPGVDFIGLAKSRRGRPVAVGCGDDGYDAGRLRAAGWAVCGTAGEAAVAVAGKEAG